MPLENASLKLLLVDLRDARVLTSERIEQLREIVATRL
jgi:hypothetical protein